MHHSGVAGQVASAGQTAGVLQLVPAGGIQTRVLGVGEEGVGVAKVGWRSFWRSVAVIALQLLPRKRWSFPEKLVPNKANAFQRGGASGSGTSGDVNIPCWQEACGQP